MADQTFGILEILLLGARAFGLFAAFAAFAWALMRMRREHAEQLEQVLGSQRELLAQNQALSERVSALATLVSSPPRRSEPLVEPAQEVQPPSQGFRMPRRQAGAPSYETARRLARNGASVEEIVASSGVVGTEARLLRRLHGNQQLDAQIDETRRTNAA
jgi:hypothetical protein